MFTIYLLMRFSWFYRKGADQSQPFSHLVLSISTHSPARGLTSPHFRQSGKRGYFNSQPHKGTDTDPCAECGRKYISTHSPARGLTTGRRFTAHRYTHFNSQPRKGTDCDYIVQNRLLHISTHSPARGLTAILAKNIAWPKLFFVFISHISTNFPSHFQDFHGL